MLLLDLKKSRITLSSSLILRAHKREILINGRKLIRENI